MGGGGEGEVFGGPVGVELVGEGAGCADELGGEVESFYVLAETDCAVESGVAGFLGDWVDVCAWEGSEFEMIGSNMALECLMLAEGLVAAWISCTPEAIMARVCLFVSSKSCARQEAFVASLPIANPFSLLRVCALDMLL